MRGRPDPREPSAQKKHDRGWGRRRMRYPASEKLEIIRIVEQSHLPAKLTLDKLGIARRTFYRWYDRFLEGGPEALEEDRKSVVSGKRVSVRVDLGGCGFIKKKKNNR